MFRRHHSQSALRKIVSAGAIALAIFVSLASQASAQQREFFNGGFEANDPRGSGSPNYQIYNDTAIDEWNATTGFIELWDTNYQGVPAYEGNVFAEMNANAPGTLYQEVCLVAGETVGWSFAHRARSGSQGSDPQVALLEIANGSGVVIQSLASQTTFKGQDWQLNTGSAVYSGTSGTRRVQFRTTNPGSYGNFIDALSLDIPAFAEFAVASSEDLEASGASLPSLIINGRVEFTTTIPVSVTGGTATGDDYALSSSVLTIPAGLYNDQAFPLPLTIHDNQISEPDETITFSLGTPSTGEVIFAQPNCTGAPPQTTTSYTIINDDGRLEGNKTVEIYDPGNIGLYALPGNDVIYTITIANTGTVDVDSGSMFLTDALPIELIFFNGDIDDSGPETEAVIFSSTGAGLLLGSSNVKFSDQSAKPTAMSECVYLPLAGYDPAVKHICFAPQGLFEATDPDSFFSVGFRAKIK